MVAISAIEVSAQIRKTTLIRRMALALLALCFSIGGLAGVWWAGSYEIGESRATAQVEFVSTLWETTVTSSVNGQSKEDKHTIDDTCGESNLNDETKSRCDMIGAVRAFVCLHCIMCLASVVCPLWPHVKTFRKGGVPSQLQLQKSLLITAVCNVVASFCALLAVAIASTLDFGDLSGNVGVNGGGFVLTILSMVLCLVPGVFLETLAWRWTYLPPAPAATVARPVNMPTLEDLPNLVHSKPSESNVSKTQHGDVELGDVEPAAIGHEQTTV